jgi:hypothetical protein
MILDLGQLSVDAKFHSVDVSPPFLAGEIKIRPPVFEALFTVVCLVVAVSIRPNLKPDKMQGVRGMIQVNQFHFPVQGLLLIIQSGGQVIAEALIPVRLTTGRQNEKQYRKDG